MRITFVTAVMNRLEHLLLTLPQNMIKNERAEFIVLDYNSVIPVARYLCPEPRLHVYRTDEPKFWHMSHAKNVCIKLAEDGVVVNVDADNYCGRDFDVWCLRHVNERCIARGSFQVQPGSGGRIAALRSQLIAACGYNEQLTGWGIEDTDLVKRLGKIVVKVPRRYVEVIKHDDTLRMANYPPGTPDKRETAKNNIKEAANGWKPTSWGDVLHYRDEPTATLDSYLTSQFAAESGGPIPDP